MVRLLEMLVDLVVCWWVGRQVGMLADSDVCS